MTTIFSPNALCFGEEFPASGAPCLVQIEGDGLTITHEPTVSTSPSERVLFTGLTVSAGGLDHDHLVLKWGEGYRRARCISNIPTSSGRSVKRRRIN